LALSDAFTFRSSLFGVRLGTGAFPAHISNQHDLKPEATMNRIRELLQAKAKIEATLEGHGIALDPQARDAIGWALKSQVECDGCAVDVATERVIATYKAAA